MNQAHLIKNEKPPVWDRLVEAFPNLEWKDIAITYGGVIYSPNPVEDNVLVHEMVHVRQQQGKNANEWMERYIADPEFRYKQELLAYQVEYKFWKKHFSKRDDVLTTAIEGMAKTLSGPLYNNIVTYEQALKDIHG